MRFCNAEVERQPPVTGTETPIPTSCAIKRRDAATRCSRRMSRACAVLRACGFSLPLCMVYILQPLTAQTGAGSAELKTDIERGQAALKANNQALAAEQFRAALKLDPGNVEAHANLGAMAFLQGDCSGAERELRSALEAAPTLMKAQALIAICEKRTGSHSAQADLQSAFAKLKYPQLRVQVGVELADLYYQNGDLDHTLTMVHTLVDLDPDNVDLLFFAQRIYSEMADDTMNKFALLAPDSARMQQLIAERLINAGDLKGAIEHYRKALAADPRLPGMHFELAEAILESSNQPAEQVEALKELDAAVSSEGDNSRIECAYGRIAALQGKFDEALMHYQRAYKMDPNSGQAQFGMGKTLADQNKPDEALKYLRMAVQTDPMNASAHYRLTRVCRALHLDDEAKKEMKLFQEVRQAKDRLAQLYREMDRRPEPEDDVPAEQQP
jgi:tetratricopeptide (TPR) repeat protein